jgi:hypothetical protein
MQIYRFLFFFNPFFIYDKEKLFFYKKTFFPYNIISITNFYNTNKKNLQTFILVNLRRQNKNFY